MGWMEVFVFPQMLYGYSVLNLFDICGFIFYPQMLDRCYTDVFCLKSVDLLFSADVRQILCYPRHCILCQERDGDLVGKMVNVEIHQAGIGNRILYASLLD